MSKWVILITALVVLSVSRPALTTETAPLAAEASMPATVKIELTWQQQSSRVTYAITGKSLGTLMGPNLILTHNHFNVPPGALATGTLTVTDQAGRSRQWRTAEVQLISIDVSTTLIWLPNGTAMSSARTADMATLQRLAVGDRLAVNYWDDATSQLAQQDFTIMRIQNSIAQLADPNRVIHSGDSGGGAYFNGQLVGNTWSINLDSARHAIGSFNVALLPSQVRSYVQ
jgi:hypothetical protein